MKTQIVYLLIGVLLPYVWACVTDRYRRKQFGDIGLKEPRVQAEQLERVGVRA